MSDDERPEPVDLRKRRLDYDAVQAYVRSQGDLKARLGYRRGVRTRERDPDEARSLIRLDRSRLEAAYASGEREWLGPRRLRLRL